MLKYVDTLVAFSEIPDEISLCINISGCPNNCPGCHSSYLAEDIGEELTKETLKKLVERNKGITCICLMGGDQLPFYIQELADFCKQEFITLKVAWYSGKQELPKDFNTDFFDYIKLGPYIESLGPLTSKTTNQRLYKFSPYYSDWTIGPSWKDITYKF